jgi:hypothetical protein
MGGPTFDTHDSVDTPSVADANLELRPSQFFSR